MVRDKTPSDLAYIMAHSQYVHGTAKGLKEAACILQREASDAFSSHDDLVAQRLRSVADQLSNEYEKQLEIWRRGYASSAREAEEKLEQISKMPAVAGWLQVLGNAEEE